MADGLISPGNVVFPDNTVFPDSVVYADNVVDVLLAQHARIEELFALVITTRGAARARAFDDLVRLLAIHEAAEQEVVHPLARGSIDAGDEVVAARLAEERATSGMLDALAAQGVTDPGFDAGILALRDAVLTHAKYEERYEFPQLRHFVDTERLRSAAAGFRAAQTAADALRQTSAVAGE